MHFERGSRSLLLAAILMLSSMASSHAGEIPSLTWERGKSQSVVLGGETEKLDWNLFLEGARGFTKSFGRSQKSDLGFYVFSIRLPNQLPIGSYVVVSRDDNGISSVVAGVQVIERISYDIREIPLDLAFLLVSFLGFLAMQISVRRWRLLSPLALDDDPTSQESARHIGRLSEALFRQRLHWQKSWLGLELKMPGEPVLPFRIQAFAPLIALMLAIFGSIQEVIFPISDVKQTVLVGILALIAFWDRHSGRLVFLTCFAALLLTKTTLNMPSLIAITIFLALFLLPRYVGDLVLALFGTIEGKGLVLRYQSIFLSGIAVGLGVFWIYLVSESVTKAGQTDASHVTPIAIILAMSQVLRSLRRDSESVSRAAPAESFLPVEKPVLTPSFTALVVITSFGIVFSWTTSAMVAAVFSGLALLSLITVFLQPSAPWPFAMKLLRQDRTLMYVSGVFILTGAIIFLINQIPETVVGRSDLVLLLSPLPLLLFSFLRLFVVENNKRVEVK
jgi:hypothetical protein